MLLDEFLISWSPRLLDQLRQQQQIPGRMHCLVRLVLHPLGRCYSGTRRHACTGKLHQDPAE
jgi:hypothetical protein